MNQPRHLVLRTDVPEKLAGFYIDAYGFPVFSAEPELEQDCPWEGSLCSARLQPACFCF